MTEYEVEHSQGMHVMHDGPRDAPALLLIHGSGASGSSWGPMVAALAGHHHVIRVDLPGCGQSPPARSYDVLDQAGRIAAVLDDLGLRHVTVVGHSSGGYIATALADQRPDLVQPLGPLLWPWRSDAMIRKGDQSDGRSPGGHPG